ncbi:MAG TPA: DUF364 domain-containing protein [Spirochaetia bacterium]|nr:DUF364 domain-containing protein [Spirochaetia bacterium]
MEIYRRIYDILRDRAARTKVRQLCVGLGYTAVLLDDESVGIAYTWFESKTSCSLFEDPADYEGKPALGLLEKIFSEDLLERSISFAAANALNRLHSAGFNDDRGTLLDDLGVREGSRVSMAGYFEPVAREIERRGGQLNVYDIGKGVGSDTEFYAGLRDHTDVLIVSSTSLIHGSTEELLSHVDPQTPCVLLGPTTPMIPEAFSHLPVAILGGTLPLDSDAVLKAIRHARGTRAIHRASRKVYWKR